MRTTFGAPRVRFDWRSFITPAVKILALICAGVFLVQTLIAELLPRCDILVQSCIWTCSHRRHSWVAYLAALYLHLPARRPMASPHQHAHAVDVWAGTRTGLGQETLPELFFRLRCWRWNYHHPREVYSILGTHSSGYTNHRSLRRHLRHPHRQCHSLSRAPDLALSSAYQ